jgi:hypothetical protein
MKTLIIHPEDVTTDFLKPIYETIPVKTVVTGGISKEALRELIGSHDRIMMLGHGSPWGLLSVGRFPDAGLHLVDNSMAELLKTKENNVFIWCYAQKFVEDNDLEGFYSGMFISEVLESKMMGLTGIDQSVVDQSNDSFGSIAGRYINERNPEVICKKIRQDYGKNKNNPVICYNNARLNYYLRQAVR